MKWAGQEEMDKQAKQSISARQAKKRDRDRRAGKFVPLDESEKKQRSKKRSRSEGGEGGSVFDSDIAQDRKKQKTGSAFESDGGGKRGKKEGKKEGAVPERKPLGKKRSHHQFKSKKRYQRR